MRLFVAIALPADVRQRLALLCNGVPGARWSSKKTVPASPVQVCFHVRQYIVGASRVASGAQCTRIIANEIYQEINPVPATVC